MHTANRILSACLIATLAAASAAAALSSQELSRAAKFQRKGLQAMSGGDLEKAREQFGKSLEVVPTYPDAHIGLGQIAMAEKQYEQALAHFEQARDGYAELGASLLDIRSKRYGQAQSQISTIEDQIQHLEGQSGGGASGGGSAAGGMNAVTIQKMRNQQEQLRAIEPPDPDTANVAPGEIFFYIGNARYQLKQPKQALEAWETCRERSPKFAMVYNNLALVYMQTGRLGEARSSLATAEELGFPVNPQFKAQLESAAAK